MCMMYSHADMHVCEHLMLEEKSYTLILGLVINSHYVLMVVFMSWSCLCTLSASNVDPWNIQLRIQGKWKKKQTSH